VKPRSKPQSGMQASSATPTFKPVTAAEITQAAFLRHLQNIPGPPVTLLNAIDDSSPPLGYRFIETCKLGTGVSKADDGFMSGCDCKPNNGRNVGCEYTKCGCLSEAEPGPNDKQVFPYWCTGPRNGCLRDFYLESRHAIFECNMLCRCQANCKNRNVQHGRKIQLEIFKTPNRGWGRLMIPLACKVDRRLKLTQSRTTLSTTTTKRSIHRHLPRRDHHQRRSRQA